jgi:hypothetical protein
VEGCHGRRRTSATMSDVPFVSESPDGGNLSVARSLRRAVLDYRAGPTRPRPTWLHVGEPGGEQVCHDVRRDEPLDAALRVEVVSALLVRCREQPDRRSPVTSAPPTCWLARPGVLAWQDADRDWLSAGTTAYAEAGLPLTFVVVGPSGWWDPRSGELVEWKRLRDRSRKVPG